VTHVTPEVSSRIVALARAARSLLSSPTIFPQTWPRRRPQRPSPSSRRLQHARGVGMSRPMPHVIPLTLAQQEVDQGTAPPESPGLFFKFPQKSQRIYLAAQMLDILSTPLPPTLPPSPPASRAASPAPGSKRKPDPSSSSDLDAAKRPRTSSIVDRSQHQSSQPSSHLSHGQPFQVPPPPTHYSATSRPSRTEPCEDGEVREEPVAGARGSSAPFPRPLQRRPKFSIKVGDTMHDKYRNAGRMLKYSGDARFWSTFPPSHKEYRPLSKPPPVDSSYHRDAQLMARLELLDALICFTYALWCKDYARDAKNVETWKTAIPFLAWCKNKWTKEATIDNDDELALSGLMYVQTWSAYLKLTLGTACGLTQPFEQGFCHRSSSTL